MAKDKTVYYLGYGSNMSVDYLIDRRKVRPIESERALLDDYKLIMNMEGPNFLEPSFANIKKEKGFQVEGVLHKILETDLQKIVNTEGENYQLTNLLVRTGKSRRKACTLIYITEEPKDIPPSRRYMKILINAAKKSKLSDGYIRNLEKRPFVYYPILSEMMSLRVYLWVWLRT